MKESTQSPLVLTSATGGGQSLRRAQSQVKRRGALPLVEALETEAWAGLRIAGRTQGSQSKAGMS